MGAKCCKKLEEEIVGRPLPTYKQIQEERAAESRAYMARYAPGPGYVWNPDTGLFEKELSPPSSPPSLQELPTPSSPPSPYWHHVCSTPAPSRSPAIFRYRLPGGGRFTKPAGDASTISR